MSTHYPRRFGKYLLLRSLAKGGMGEIYMAALGQIGGFEKLCVIKKVLSEQADPSKAKRFLDEAKVVLRLNHSALVNTFDAGEVDGEFYIAMEMVEGKDLREVWNRCVRRRQRIPIEVALHVAREVARVLAYVHGYGDLKLVHRDIAPPNILLGYNGDVKLTDFGLARSALKEEKTNWGAIKINSFMTTSRWHYTKGVGFKRQSLVMKHLQNEWMRTQLFNEHLCRFPSSTPAPRRGQPLCLIYSFSNRRSASNCSRSKCPRSISSTLSFRRSSSSATRR